MAKVTPRVGELTTANYGWVKPTVGSSTDAWGGYLNADLDGIDATVKGVATSLGGYLKLTGGSLSGTLTGTGAVFTGLTINGATLFNSPSPFLMRSSTAGDVVISFQDSTPANRSQLLWQASTGNFAMFNLNGGGEAWIAQDMSFNVNGAAFKPSGGSWSATSDERVKTVQGDYPAGLDEVLQLRPVVYTFKGNDTPTADVNASLRDTPDVAAAPYPGSPHYQAAMDQTQFVGFVAQEVETLLPDMVSQRAGYIDGQAVSDLRNIDVSNLVYALVNAVKTLSARVEALEAAR